MEALESRNIDYQRVAPGMHRVNTAERAIRFAKNHILSGLALCPKDFPIREWDKLITQAELTINLLRNSRVNPNLSAWAYLFGNHDFNKVPLAPPGTKVIIHSKPGERKSWECHGKEGFYIGPAFHHYRCIQVFMPDTHATRYTDTARMIPDKVPIPLASIDDHLRATAEHLVKLLINKKS